MRTQFSLSRFFVLSSALLLMLPGAVWADRGDHGGGRGGYHTGAGFHGYARGAGHPVYAPRAYYGRAYYGRPYYRGYYGPGWYGALALGTFVATLPLYYDTYWWGGTPYYYYDHIYYRWNSGVSKYEVVAPPSADDANVGGSSPTDLFAYPKNGQSEEQQKTDRYECHRWAADQTGFDPTRGAGQDTSKSADYVRAETACLTGRGYSVK